VGNQRASSCPRRQFPRSSAMMSPVGHVVVVAVWREMAHAQLGPVKLGLLIVHSATTFVELRVVGARRQPRVRCRCRTRSARRRLLHGDGD